MFSEAGKTRIEKQFRQLLQEMPVLRQETDGFNGLKPETALAMKYLYITMPFSDIGNYSFDTFLDYAEHGIYLWEHGAYSGQIPESVFLNYILYHRVNEEEILPCRTFFHECLKDRVKGLAMKEAALEVNYWCGEEAAYQSTDARTAAPITVYNCGYGRCGEESAFAVSALRSIGIPARQVYAPRWSHCDDNHAWVEVWCDGSWYFFGACEPEEILNKGWFNSASSRAMLIHSRRFDSAGAEKETATGEKNNNGNDITGEEEIIGKNGRVTMLNQLGRYALTGTVTVRVTDEEGHPVEDARVEFQVVNYSELFSLAVLKTDIYGKALLKTGLGSIHIHVSKDSMDTDLVIDTREQKEAVLVLKAGILSESCWQPFDMIAPLDSPVNNNMPNDMQKAEGEAKYARAAKKRQDKVKKVRNKEIDRFLDSGPGPGLLREKMVGILTAKDRDDCKAEVLEEHFRYALPYMELYKGSYDDSYNDLQGAPHNGLQGVPCDDLQVVPCNDLRTPHNGSQDVSFHDSSGAPYNGSFCEEIFLNYVINPRVRNEPLYKYRGRINDYFTHEDKGNFCKHPARIWDWIEKNIQSHEEREQPNVVTTPGGCLKTGTGSNLSKHILFVAVARTLGIPARLKPEDDSMEYWSEGKFRPVIERAAGISSLLLLAGNSITWTYYQNYTIGRYHKGSYSSLNLEGAEFCNGQLKLSLEPGKYRILTSNRLPNGNIFANRYLLTLKAGEEKEVSLSLREARLSDMLENITINDFYLKREEGRIREDSKPGECGKTVSGSEITKGGKKILFWLEEGKEPTEHILNELLDRKKEFGEFAVRLNLIIRDKKSLENQTLSKVVEAFPEAVILYDDFQENVRTLSRRLYVDPDKLPLIVVTSKALKAIYAASGYNVGTGDMLLRLLREELVSLK